MSMVNVTNLGFGGSGIPDSLPKAIAELQGLKLAVVTGAAAGTVMVVPGMDPEDTIGAAVDLTTPASIDAATLTIAGRTAQATITCLTTAVDGDKVTVNGKVHTFKDIIAHTSYNAPPGVIPIDITPSGSDPEEMAERLAKAIMSADSTLTATVGPDTSSPPLQAKVTVKVRVAGVAGNAYTLTETGTAVTVSGATFTGGVAGASAGFTSSANLTGKKVLVLWYDKVPSATEPVPLFLREGEEEEDDEESRKKGRLIFRGGKQEEEDEGRDDDRGNDKKPGPGKPKAGR